MSMKILLCSDSHGNNAALEEIYHRYPKCDLYLHAGDSESDEYSIRPFEAVKGNCDFGGYFEDRRLINTPYGVLLMQHYPTIPHSIINKYKVRIFVYGHAHTRVNKKEEGLIIINPGSIAFPRDGHDLSFAILDISASDVHVEFHSLLEK